MTPCIPAQAAAQGTACDGSGSTTMSPAQGAELAQFISFVACLGQSKVAALGYAPLPPNLVEDDFQAAGRLPGGTEPPPPTATSCQNPTITGGTSSISARGPLSTMTSPGRTTLSVSAPTIGDAWVLAVRVSSPSITVSSVNGGGAHDTWTKLSQVTDTTQKKDIEEWLGPISQAGAPEITVHFSGSVSGTEVQLDAQQFTAGGGGATVWSKDVAGSAENDAASSTITFPTPAPSASNELYVGFSRAGSDSTGGATPGFTYEAPALNNLYIYDPSVSSSVSPTGSELGGLSVTTGALIEAS